MTPQVGGQTDCKKASFKVLGGNSPCWDDLQPPGRRSDGRSPMCGGTRTSGGTQLVLQSGVTQHWDGTKRGQREEAEANSLDHRPCSSRTRSPLAGRGVKNCLRRGRRVHADSLLGE